MAETQLRLIVRTPSEVVLELNVSSLRVPTESGQVGIRPRAEPMVLAVESGLVVIRIGSAYEFAGTAGGLLRCDGTVASLLTPLAVSGANELEVLESLDSALEQPNVELQARATLSRLQNSILRELREKHSGRSRPLGDAV